MGESADGAVASANSPRRGGVDVGVSEGSLEQRSPVGHFEGFVRPAAVLKNLLLPPQEGAVGNHLVTLVTGGNFIET